MIRSGYGAEKGDNGQNGVEIIFINGRAHVNQYRQFSPTISPLG